jgi:hypothetical protein
LPLDGEGADDGLAGVEVLGVGDPDVAGRLYPPWQEVASELVRRPEGPALAWSVHVMLSAYSLVMASKFLALKAS